MGRRANVHNRSIAVNASGVGAKGRNGVGCGSSFTFVIPDLIRDPQQHCRNGSRIKSGMTIRNIFPVAQRWGGILTRNRPNSRRPLCAQCTVSGGTSATTAGRDSTHQLPAISATDSASMIIACTIPELTGSPLATPNSRPASAVP